MFTSMTDVTHGLLQHVSGPTHVHGHTLDVLITRGNGSLLLGLPSIRDPCICDNKGNPSSDHFAVFTCLNTGKPPKKRETVSFRKNKVIDVSEFKSDIQNSGLVQDPWKKLLIYVIRI
jgi:hypothetical protein